MVIPKLLFSGISVHHSRAIRRVQINNGEFHHLSTPQARLTVATQESF